MSVATANVLEELAAMGVDVAPFKNQGSGKQLIWNEVRFVSVLSASDKLACGRSVLCPAPCPGHQDTMPADMAMHPPL